MKISQWVSDLLSGHDFPIKIFQRDIILSNMSVELRSLFSAHCLMMHCIYTKFHETILKDLRVIEQTQFVMDRQKDGQMYV